MSVLKPTLWRMEYRQTEKKRYGLQGTISGLIKPLKKTTKNRGMG
jgi:hypothetical protein